MSDNKQFVILGNKNPEIKPKKIFDEGVIDFLDQSGNKWNNHVDLSLWADIFVIAPATANTIAKMASGLCDNMLLATFLSCTCPIFCAPAMDRDMYLNRSTVKNLQILKKRGVNILKVESGELASGLHGLGRMRDINKMYREIEVFFFIAIRERKDNYLNNTWLLMRIKLNQGHVLLRVLHTASAHSSQHINNSSTINRLQSVGGNNRRKQSTLDVLGLGPHGPWAHLDPVPLGPSTL